MDELHLPISGSVEGPGKNKGVTAEQKERPRNRICWAKACSYLKKGERVVLSQNAWGTCASDSEEVASVHHWLRLELEASLPDQVDCLRCDLRTKTWILQWQLPGSHPGSAGGER